MVTLIEKYEAQKSLRRLCDPVTCVITLAVLVELRLVLVALVSSIQAAPYIHREGGTSFLSLLQRTPGTVPCRYVVLRLYGGQCVGHGVGPARRPHEAACGLAVRCGLHVAQRYEPPPLPHLSATTAKR